ncbi:MAG TPA: hypothetical protein VH723_08035, partial [Candidatus Limnocylindrales bacterium]
LDRAAHERAVEEASRVARQRGRPTLASDIRETTGDWLIRAGNDVSFHASFPVVGRLQLPFDLTVKGRLQIASSLADALLAIALWDALDDATKDELLGPWVQFVNDD